MVTIPAAWDVSKGMAQHAMARIAEAAAIGARITGETINLADWAKKATDGLSDQRHKARSLAGVARVLAANGFADQAILLVYAALLSARMAGRDTVFEVIAEAADTIAAIDDGETLWKIYEEIAAIDAWR